MTCYSNKDNALYDTNQAITVMNDSSARPDATEVQRVTTEAIPQDETTEFGAIFSPLVKSNPGKSGFAFLETGAESLNLRLSSILAAQKTIDLQYYTIHDDVSANLLLEALLQAADRGVRIRFLIDNTSMKDVGRSLSVLNSIENMEIRVYNPLTVRKQTLLSKLQSICKDFYKATKRMHNKALIVDNQVAIVGGRNLGDEYFDAHADMNFKDTDFFIAGPIVSDISASFDNYWNGDNSFPIESLKKPKETTLRLLEIREDLNERWNKELARENNPYMSEPGHLLHLIKQRELKLCWAPARIAIDDAAKTDKPEASIASRPLARLDALVQSAARELIVVSPYFIPQQEGVEWLKDLINKGLAVKVLTNSLASTDVVAVHAGYRKYRKALLQAGVTLFEMKPVAGKRPRQRVTGTTTPAHAGLHAKIYIVDRRKLLVGSFNFDPRSQYLNTELAIEIDCEQIASEVMDMFEKTAQEKTCFLPRLQAGNIVWTTQDDMKSRTFFHEPKAGLWRTLQVKLFSLILIENQL